MPRIAVRALFVLLMVGVAVTVSQAAETLQGSFVWKNEDGESTGDLKAVFTNTGRGTWDVSFHFVWEDEPRVWKGTAEGDLSRGKLEGKVVNEDNTFTFSGRFQDGTFQGTHAHIGKEGKRSETGTLTLKR